MFGILAWDTVGPQLISRFMELKLKHCFIFLYCVSWCLSGITEVKEGKEFSGKEANCNDTKRYII